MATFVSPGTYTLERDLSNYISDLSATIVALVGTSESGPSNVPQYITSAKQFVEVFGKANPKHYLGYAALAYLDKGSALWVTRVTSPTAKRAALTLPVPDPTNAKQFAGEWILDSVSGNSAVLELTDYSSLASTSKDKTIKVDAGTKILGYRFNDTAVTEANIAVLTGTEPGSCLYSFLGATPAAAEKVALREKYVKGKTFSILTGPGKDTSTTILDLNFVNNKILATVDAKKFNPYANPVVSVPSGTITFPSVASTAIAAGDVTVIATNGSGKTITIAAPSYVKATSDAAMVALSAIDAVDASAAQTWLTNNMTAASGDVTVTVPFYSGTDYSVDLNSKMLYYVLKTILSSADSKLTSFKVPATGAGSTPDGVAGIGSYNTTTGASNGYRAVELLTTGAGLGTAVKLYGLVSGYLGSYAPTSVQVVLVKAVNISGTFALDLYRPSWVTSVASTVRVPTLLKFKSAGEGDFSNLAVTVTADAENKTAAQEQNYTVRLYQRLVSDSIPTDSLIQSNFLLLESYDGTLENVVGLINSASKYISAKIDYTTVDGYNYAASTIDGGTVNGYVHAGDELFVECAFTGDVLGKGITVGARVVADSSLYVPSFSSVLSGGTVGDEITKEDIIGTITADTKTGIQSFSDPEDMDINLLVVPGWSADPAVAKSMLDLCTKRSDCFSIIDTPFALSVQNVVNYRKKVLNANSNYGALYYPWVKINDPETKKDIFIPPSGLVAAQFAYNDTVGEVFTAPAGRNRGVINAALATERTLNQGDRDLLCVNQINPIHNEAGAGIYIRGQYTLQTNTTALDRVNVRRLLLKLRKVVATASKAFEFEPGDAVTALRLKQITETFLEDYLRKGALRSYVVDVGPNVNTASTLENNELRMEINLVPVKTAERIVETFTILGQGKGLQIGA